MLKLDLHTHCLEAIGFEHPTVAIVERIVASIKAAGIDGIAVTDHSSRHYHYPHLIRDIVAEHFHNEVLIIPGREVSRATKHVVELSLPGKVTFRFVAHPGYPVARYWDDDLKDIHGLEIANDQYPLDEDKIREVARSHGLMLLSNSDAHHLENIGNNYNEVDLDELCKLASQTGQKV